MGSIEGYDYRAHNQMVAKKRGKSWKNKLREQQALKVKLNANATVLANLRVDYTPHLTQEAMLLRVGKISQPRYARIERGELLAPEDIARKIAKVFKKEIKDIFVKVDANKFLAI